MMRGSCFGGAAMRVNEVAKMLGGWMAIYVIMAACSAGSGRQVVASSGAASGAGASGSLAASGSQSSSGLGVDGSQSESGRALVDALTDPVSSAMADATQSGTRLKVKYYAGADGSKQFFGLHDSQLNVDCNFITAADGVSRSLPDGAFSPNLFVHPSSPSPIPESYRTTCPP